MKKIAIISALALAAVGAHAQGTINFNPHVTGQVFARVFAPDTANPGLVVSGNTSADFPVGTQTYTGIPIGGTATGTGFDNGNRYTAQLFAAPGTGQPASSLIAVSQYISTFRTAAGGGGYFINVSPATDNGIPNTPTGIATLQLRVWDNQGGSITTYGAASTRGASPTFDVTNLGGIGAPPNTSTSPYMTGLQSFNIQSVPEPSTIALGVMGAAAFLLRRKKK